LYQGRISRIVIIIVVLAYLEKDNQSQKYGYRRNESAPKPFVLFEQFCERNIASVASHDGLYIYSSE
jgi:hypothetical protein